jgi:hypothetical protein
MIAKKDVTGPKAFTYLKEQLYLGGKTLSNSIERITIEAGKVYAFVPENTPNEVLYDFNEGVIYPFDRELLRNKPALIPVQNESRPFVMNFVLEYLSEGNDNCCIFEDPVGSPEFPYLINPRKEYVYIKDEMFYFFDKLNNDEAKFKSAFKDSEAYYFLCALSKVEINDHILFYGMKKIDPQLIEKIVKNIVSFIVRAYDGEGYLIWNSPKES